MKDGIKERFGEDVFEQLDKYNEIEINTKDQFGDVINFKLTKRVNYLINFNLIVIN